MDRKEYVEILIKENIRLKKDIFKDIPNVSIKSNKSGLHSIYYKYGYFGDKKLLGNIVFHSHASDKGNIRIRITENNAQWYGEEHKVHSIKFKSDLVINIYYKDRNNNQSYNDLLDIAKVLILNILDYE